MIHVYLALTSPEIVEEILRLVKEAKDLDALDAVQELTKSVTVNPIASAVRFSAQDVAAALGRYRASIQPGLGLLRASSGPESTEILLRPAGVGSDQELQLLRPSTRD